MANCGCSKLLTLKLTFFLIFRAQFSKLTSTYLNSLIHILNLSIFFYFIIFFIVYIKKKISIEMIAETIKKYNVELFLSYSTYFVSFGVSVEITFYQMLKTIFAATADLS